MMTVVMRRRASTDMFSSRETVRVVMVPDGTDVDDLDRPWGVGPVEIEVIDQEGGVIDFTVGHSE